MEASLSTHAKAIRFLRERDKRIKVLRWEGETAARSESDKWLISALIEGDTNTYVATIRSGHNPYAVCECPALKKCSHLIALEALALYLRGELDLERIIR